MNKALSLFSFDMNQSFSIICNINKSLDTYKYPHLQHFKVSFVAKITFFRINEVDPLLSRKQKQTSLIKPKSKLSNGQEYAV